MRLLADENFSRLLVHRLRRAGHDVAWIKEDAPGSADRSVLARAQRESRIVVTFDKGFGELAFRAGLPASCGVFLLRVRGSSPAAVAELAEAALRARNDWRGVFARITEHSIRIRPLPPS